MPKKTIDYRRYLKCPWCKQGNFYSVARNQKEVSCKNKKCHFLFQIKDQDLEEYLVNLIVQRGEENV